MYLNLTNKNLDLILKLQNIVKIYKNAFVFSGKNYKRVFKIYFYLYYSYFPIFD